MPSVDRRLMVFARDPGCGPVKSRLAATLGADIAQRIYQRLLDDTLRTAGQVGCERRELWADRVCEGARLGVLADRYGLSLRHQHPGDLGERMYHALAAQSGVGCRSVLIGCDCPEFDVRYIGRAFRELEHHDAVLGPAGDGGYVLIGMKQPEPRIFEAIPWGGPDVTAMTRQRLRERGWRWSELPTLHDVDEAGDLQRFPQLAVAAGIDPADGRIT